MAAILLHCRNANCAPYSSALRGGNGPNARRAANVRPIPPARDGAVGLALQGAPPPPAPVPPYDPFNPYCHLAAQLKNPAACDGVTPGAPRVAKIDLTKALQAIMTANTPAGATWKQIAYNNPDSPNKGVSKLAEGFLGNATGQKMWQRTDDAILWLRSNLIVRLELPIAREYEARLKADKEQKARASVPQF